MALSCPTTGSRCLRSCGPTSPLERFVDLWSPRCAIHLTGLVEAVKGWVGDNKSIKPGQARVGSRPTQEEEWEAGIA